MKKIELTRGLSALVDDADFEWLSKWKWYALSAGRGKFYAARDTRKTGGNILLMHREILGQMGALLGDHIDRNRLNNQRANLRKATKTQDLGNTSRRSDNKSGFKGVSWSELHGKWRADITIFGKTKFLGCFKCPKEAALNYDAAAIEKFGKFANPNFPKQTNNKQQN